MLLKSIALFILQGLFFETGFSQDLPEIEPDRPGETIAPNIVAANRFQIETGFSFEKEDKNSLTYTYPSVLLRYGVSNDLELRVSSDHVTSKFQNEKSSGITPVEVGFKVNLLKEKGAIPLTSFIGSLTIPYFASHEFQTTWYAPSFAFSMEHTVTDKTSFGYNLGAQWDGETPEPTFLYTVTANYSISDKTGTYIELYGFLPQKSQSNHSIDGGFTYLLKNNLMLDISGDFGISKNASRYYTELGFSYRFKN